MEDADLVAARKEIHETLSWCNFCTRRLAISFIDEEPKTILNVLMTYLYFIVSAAALQLLIGAHCLFITELLINSNSVAEFVASLHIVGYGIMSYTKLLTIWFKRHVFRQLVSDLAKIWPVTVKEEEASLKRNTLRALRLGQFWYMFWNVFGVCFYSLTPIAVYVYRLSRGEPAQMGFIWRAAYPMDKTKPINHVFIFLFEVFGGSVSVWSMLGSDIMFTSMASYISMLLRILQVKIRSLAMTHGDDNQHSQEETRMSDCYEDIISVIQIHQRLISYSNDIEDAFSMVNLINVLLSSVNICCVTFNIVLLEPWMEMSNKFFLGAALTQVGILCWYADDIHRSSIGVSDAAYESGWYKSNLRCRRALLLLLQRSQKPLCFTALKFHNITMATYRSILTSAYSYFALLYTMYSS